MRVRYAWLLQYLVCTVAFATQGVAHAGAPNVILITLDGVRWQEFYGATDPALNGGDQRPTLPYFWQTLAPQGVVLGNRSPAGRITVSNSVVISLPAYQSIMAGATQPCLTNECGRIDVETLPERLVRELRLSKGEVATFASWIKIAYAVEKQPGSTLVVAGPQPGEARPKWADARWDQFTFDQAMGHLKTQRPRFMYLSLNDTDEWGHLNRYADYLTALRTRDQWFKQLFAQLDSMGEYGRDTTVIITTDHGRGNGSQWTDHGVFVGGAKDIWMYARGPRVSQSTSRSAQVYTHNDIRPTIERLMGLAPLSGSGAGSVIKAIAGE